MAGRAKQQPQGKQQVAPPTTLPNLATPCPQQPACTCGATKSMRQQHEPTCGHVNTVIEVNECYNTSMRNLEGREGELPKDAFLASADSQPPPPYVKSVHEYEYIGMEPKQATRQLH